MSFAFSVGIPRVEMTRGTRAGEPSAGDEAIARSGTGLVRLLDGPFAGLDWALGSGYQPRYTVPFGLAVSAAIAALGETDPLQQRWMVRSARIEWKTLLADDETLTAMARVASLGACDATAEVATRGEESGELLHASIRILRMQRGRYSPMADVAPSMSMQQRSTGTREAAKPEAASALFAVRAPELREDAGGGRFHPDLLRLMMNPIAGNAQPLGRYVHPLGAVPLGAALTVAFASARGRREAMQRPFSTEAEWYAPAPTDAPILARVCADGEGSGVRAEVRDEGGRVLFRARITSRLA